jgi:hypothetical protein
MNATFETILDASTKRDAAYRSMDAFIASSLDPMQFVDILNAADYMYDVVHNMYMEIDKGKTGVLYTSAVIMEFRRRRSDNYNLIPEYIRRVREDDGTPMELAELRASIDSDNAKIVERLDHILSMFMTDVFAMGS